MDFRKLDKTPLNEQNINLEVKNPTQKAGRIFSKSFILYDVTPLLLNWTVQGRFSDFYTLRQILVNIIQVTMCLLYQVKK